MTGHEELERALTEALAFVKHSGDYGTLWINHDARKAHLTMGDADGDGHSGHTSFEAVRRAVESAVQPFWPDWRCPGGPLMHEPGSPLVIGDEYHPVENDGDDGWKEVGPIGREATVVDELQGRVWMELIHAQTVCSATRAWWRLPGTPSDLTDDQLKAFLDAVPHLETAADEIKEAIEILRPVAQPRGPGLDP